jgi:hypothetical protein
MLPRRRPSSHPTIHASRARPPLRTAPRSAASRAGTFLTGQAQSLGIRLSESRYIRWTRAFCSEYQYACRKIAPMSSTIAIGQHEDQRKGGELADGRHSRFSVSRQSRVRMHLRGRHELARALEPTERQGKLRTRPLPLESLTHDQEIGSSNPEGSQLSDHGAPWSDRLAGCPAVMGSH